MDIKSKHRIIGIVVLVALAIIIIPLFFGRSPEKGPRLASNIPNAPSKPEVQLAIPAPGNAPVASKAADLAVQPLQPASSSSSVLPGDNAAPAPEEAPAAVSSSTPAATPIDAPIPTAAPKTIPKVTPKNHHGVPRNKTGAVKSKLAKHHSETKLASVGEAWTIQLASFSERANAQQLIKQLRAKGFAAYMHEAKTKESLVCRVFVGPELNREKANVVAQKLHNEFSLKGVVVKYRV